MSSAIQQAFLDAGIPRERLKPETRMQTLRRERPELFRPKLDRVTENRDWLSSTREDFGDTDRRTMKLCFGAPGPVFTDEGRETRKREANTERCRRYRERKRQLDLEQQAEAEAHYRAHPENCPVFPAQTPSTSGVSDATR